MTSYRFEIENAETGALPARVEGSLRVVRTAFEDALPKGFESDDDLSVSFYKTDAIGGSDTEKITSITADANSVRDIVSGRLSALRKIDPDVPARKPRKPRKPATPAATPATEVPIETPATEVPIETPATEGDTEQDGAVSAY